MKLLLSLAAITPITAAAYFRDAAPRSAGSLLFLNTTQTALSRTTQSMPFTSVEVTSSAAGGTSQPTSSGDLVTSHISPVSSSDPTTEPIPSGDLTGVRGGLGSSTYSTEPTSSGDSTAGPGNPGLSSTLAVEPTSSGDWTTLRSGSNSRSVSTIETTNTVELTIVPGSPSSYASEPTSYADSTALRSGPGSSSIPTNPGDSTIVQGNPNLASNIDIGQTTSGDMTVAQASPNLGSDSAKTSTTATHRTTSLSDPSSIHSISASEVSPASAATHKTEPRRPVTSLQTSGSLANPSSLYSASPTVLSQSTKSSSSTQTLAFSSMLSRTTPVTATQDIVSASWQDRASGSRSESFSLLPTTTASHSATAAKAQTVEHAVAINANTSVEGSLQTTTPSTSSEDGIRVNIADNSTSVGNIAGSKTTRSIFSGRTSTASAVTLSSGGALPTTILTEATSPPLAHPTGQVQAPAQAIPRVILPVNSSSPLTDGSLIQLGFLFPLNYVFVSQHLQAAAQIFEVLPRALAQGTVQRSAIEVAKLVPYDTQATVGYITTIAKLYYPKAFVDQLQKELLNPNSDIYTKGGDMEKNLTALIDSAIKIMDDNGGIDCEFQSCNASAPGTPSSSNQKGITAGAVVGGAAFCGVLGLGVFQVYRRRGSVLAAAWPFRQRGKGRLAAGDISRPINPANSLGWDGL